MDKDLYVLGLGYIELFYMYAFILTFFSFSLLFCSPYIFLQFKCLYWGEPERAPH